MQEYYFDEIASTQEYAKNLCLSGEKEFVVFSSFQTNGRGRYARVWSSPKGGLWFSFDNAFYSENGLFTITIGVATQNVLSNLYKENIKLKWPNDIIFNNKKVGGIICEKVKERVVVGIGINTNIEDIFEEKATTFLKDTGKEINNYDTMREIIKTCKEYLKKPSEEIIKKFRENMAFIGEEYFITSLNQKAKIVDISDFGELIVKNDNGIKKVFVGEIECI